ncbi:PEP-CTERM sorting domain-containing protein [Phycisphaeraceae bacterium D3-23]
MRFSKETLVAAVAVVGCAGFAMDVDAATLGTDLVVDGGFEDVFLPGTGAYGAAELNSWNQGSDAGFTYASGQYDNGGPLAGGGDRYFTPNQSSGGDVLSPGQVSQLIDVSTGDTATQIAAGTAQYSASAFFSTYQSDDDASVVHFDFLDAGSSSLGTAEFGPGTNLQTWTQLTDSGLIPVGTATVQVSVYANVHNTGGGPDGYVDNVTFEINEVPEPGSLALLGLGGLALLRRRR